MKHVAVLILVVVSTGCSNLTSPARMHKAEIQGQPVYWFDYDASRRGTLLVPGGADSSLEVRVCAEPAPDVGLSFLSKLGVTGATPTGQDVTGSAEFNTSVIKLAERTQMVQFLREAMYRLCEQSMNGNITGDDVIRGYVKVIETALALARADAKAAEEAATKAVRDLRAMPEEKN